MASAVETSGVSILEAITLASRVTQARWDATSFLARWLLVTRARGLVTTLTSCAFVAWLSATIHMNTKTPERSLEVQVVSFGLLSLFLIFAHATGSILNDVIDHTRGLDQDDNFRALTGAHGMELTSRDRVFGYLWVMACLSLMFGVNLIFLHGEHVAIFVGVAYFFVVFYSWPLKVFALGELSMLLIWGPFIILGGTFCVVGQRDFYDNEEMWALGVYISFLCGLGPAAVLMGKHIDKIRDDPRKGVTTLPVLIGGHYARFTTIYMMCAQYVLAFVLLIKCEVAGMFFLPLVLPHFMPAIEMLWFPAPRECPLNTPGYPPKAWPLYFLYVTRRHAHSFAFWLISGLALEMGWNRVSGYLHPMVYSTAVGLLTCAIVVRTMSELGKHGIQVAYGEKRD